MTSDRKFLLLFWFYLCIFFCYLFLVQVLHVFEFLKGWEPIVAPVAFAVIFYALTGKQYDEIGKRFLLTWHVGLSPIRLGVLCLLMTVIALGLGWAFIGSQTIIFSTDLESTVSIFQVGTGQGGDIFLGEARKSSPYKKRFINGDQEFRFQADGYQDQTRKQEIQGSLSGDPKELVIELPANPKDAFKIDSLEINAHPIKPDPIPGFLHQSLDFTLTSTSPSPFSINHVELAYKGKPSKEAWSFPDFGEFSGAGAAGVIGGVIRLKDLNGSAKVALDGVAEVGSGKTPAVFRLAVFGKPGHVYSIDHFKLRAIEVKHQENVADVLLRTPDHEIAFDQDWQVWAQGAGVKDVQIVYNCQAKALMSSLPILPPSTKWRVLVADPDTDKLWNQDPDPAPDNIRAASPEAVAALCRVLGTPKRNSSRPSGAILINHQRLLMQNPNAPDRGILTDDPVKMNAIIAEFKKAYPEP